MSPFYRPSSFSPKFGADAPTPPSGSTELSHAGLSAGVETQLTTPSDISKAHTFFNPPVVGTKALAAPALVPGAEQAALSMVPPVPGVNEPISPIIQLIMRMPGHLGIMSSFFEALGHLFNPDLTMFGSLDPSILSDQAHAALNSMTAGGEHLPIDPSILPSDAPIFEMGGDDLLSAADKGVGLNALSGKLSPSFAEHLNKNPLNCSGEFDLSKPHFESSALGGQSIGASNSGLVSGPQMSGAQPSSFMAGQNRMFNDRLFAGPNNLLTSAGSQSSQALPSSLNVGSNMFGQQVSALPSASGGVPDASGQFGPSGAVSDKLGGQNLIASEGSFDSATYTPAGGSDSALSSASQAPGLKATQLTLPGVQAPHPHNVMDHIGHQSKGVPHAAHSGMDEISHRSLLKTGNAHHTAHHASGDSSHLHHKPAHEPGKMLKDAEAARTGATEKIAQADTSQISDSPVGSDAAASSYTIRPGDCLWNIAKNHGLRWQDIYNMNSDVLGKNPDLIFPGVEIKLPTPGNDLASAAGDLGKHIVKPGDSLWKIAHDHLGNGQQWGQIYQLNHNIVGANPRLIFPGQELAMPGTGGAASQLASAPVASAPTTVAHAAPSVSAPISQDATSVAPTSAGSEGMIDNATAVPSSAPAQMAGTPGRAFNSESLAPSSLRPDLGSLLQGRR